MMMMMMMTRPNQAILPLRNVRRLLVEKNDATSPSLGIHLFPFLRLNSVSAIRVGISREPIMTAHL
jgi:hypothetical protein